MNEQNLECSKGSQTTCISVFYLIPPTRLLRRQSMEFFRQEYWSGLPFPSPGDLPDPGMEPGSPALQADASPSEPAGKPYFEVMS